MRRALLTCLVLLAVAAVAAVAAPPPVPPTETRTESPAEKGEPREAPRRRPPPVSTFTPTEKIEADRSVSFPIDI